MNIVKYSFLLILSGALLSVNICFSNDIELTKTSDSLELAQDYFENANYVNALKLYLEILEETKKQGNDSLLAQSYYNVGKAHYYFRNDRSNEACLPFMEEALRLSTLYNDTNVLFRTQWAMGAIVGEMELYDSSYYLLKSARSIALSRNNFGAVSTINCIEADYKMKETQNKANLDGLLKESLEYARRSKSESTMAFAYQKLGSYQILKHQYIEAERSLQEAERLFSNLQSKNGLLNVYFELINLYSSTNQYEKLNKAYEERMRLNDEVYNHKLTESLAQMQVKYETDKKEQDNQILKVNNEKQSEIIKRKEEEQKFQTAILSILGIIVAGLLATYYYRSKAKQNALIAKQQQIQFQAVIEGEEKERKRIASELHDGLGQLLSVAKLHVSSIEENESTDELVSNSMKVIDKAVNEVRSISHNMMPNALVSLGLMAAIREELVHIEALKKFELKTDLIQSIDMDESKAIAIYRILQEALNNILKYSEASQVELAIKEVGNNLEISIIDNGVGFDTSGEGSNKNPGIGLNNMKSRVELISGNIQINSTVGMGTDIHFQIPLG